MNTKPTPPPSPLGSDNCSVSLMPKKDMDYFHGHGRVEYNTPQWLFRALDMEFKFTVDAAASKENAKCDRFFCMADDGLSKDWTNETVWVNPPYGKGITAKWLAKAYAESKKGATVVMVVPVRADAKWWHDYAMKGEIRLFRNRLNFDNDHGAKHYAPFATAVVIFRGYQFKLVSLPEVSAMGYKPKQKMTTAILIKMPQEWEELDGDGDKLADSFQLGMTLEVSTKGNHCRVYTPEDADIPFDCLQYVSGDNHPSFSSQNEKSDPR